MSRLSAFLLLVLLVMVACGSKLTNENLLKVKNGMTEEEVQTILGKPAHIETGETVGIRGTTYYYKSGQSEVKVIFLNNAVMAKDANFN